MLFDIILSSESFYDTRNRDLFLIAELIVWNILSFQILYLNCRNMRLKTIAVFRNKLLSFIRPSKRSIFNVNNPEGVKYLTRLSLRFSHLNEHKFRQGFRDTLNPLCNYSLEFEENEHFFLRCLKFENARKSLFIEISSINSSFKNFSSHLKVGLLLFVDSEHSAIDNNLIF